VAQRLNFPFCKPEALLRDEDASAHAHPLVQVYASRSRPRSSERAALKHTDQGENRAAEPRGLSTVCDANQFTLRKTGLRTKWRFVSPRGPFLRRVRGCVGGGFIAFHATDEAANSGIRATSSNRETRTCRFIAFASRPLADIDTLFSHQPSASYQGLPVLS
jgi:hypothetical protein